MALSIVERPQSCRLSDTVNTDYSLTNTGSYGDAVLSGGSALSDGDKILIVNSYDSYNGWWIVDDVGSGLFKLQRYSGADYLAYTQSHANIEIYTCIADVNYSAVHLPIIYRFLSTLFPTNSGDTTRAITAFYNDNGKIKITLDGAIDIQPLDWLFISSTTVDDLDGAFQVLTRYSTTQYTIDANYSLATDIYVYANATAVRYYNNYAASIRLYGGLNATHIWAALKPYELITTYDITPDVNNEVVFNVNEILKEKIEILLNRPNYDSEPYDLDRFSQFYVEFAESYDMSDGTEVTTFTDTYTSDKATFEGFAVDAALEFKNRYSGFMSAWVYGDATTLAKFLTFAEAPTLFSGFYMDLSFINSFGVSSLSKKIVREDEEGNVNATTYELIDDAVTSEGIIRVPISVIGDEYLQKITIVQTGTLTPFTEEKTVYVNPDCYSQYLYLTWKNAAGGFDFFQFNAPEGKDHLVSIEGKNEKDKNIYPNWPHSYGESKDSIRVETSRMSRKGFTVYSQNLTQAQVDYISGIKTSSLVQQVTSKYDRRTMIVDSDSFTVKSDGQKIYNISFTIMFTNQVASQSL